MQFSLKNIFFVNDFLIYIYQDFIQVDDGVQMIVISIKKEMTQKYIRE